MNDADFQVTEDDDDENNSPFKRKNLKNMSVTSKFLRHKNKFSDDEEISEEWKETKNGNSI